jgi:hypothetical protein
MKFHCTLFKNIIRELNEHNLKYQGQHLNHDVWDGKWIALMQWYEYTSISVLMNIDTQLKIRIKLL